MDEVLVTGVTGFVGRLAFERLHRDFFMEGTGRRPGEHVEHIADLENSNDVERLVWKIRPDAVVHCAKITKSVDYCEENKEECYKANALATKNLVNAVRMYRPDAKFVYMSTDYVYDGKRGNYTEEDPVNPVNYYGWTKLEGENFVKGLDNYLILRTTVVFGLHPGGNNFFMQLLAKQEKKEEMSVPTDQINNPTYIHLLTEIIAQGIKKDLRGIYIATGPQPLSRYDFALRIADKLGFDKRLIKPVPTSALKQAAPRPMNCSTNPSKIQRDLAWKFPPLEESLEHLKKEVENRS